MNTIFDRQMQVYGKNTRKYFDSTTILIIGLQEGYAIEICKNLISDGIGTILLYDNNSIISETDLYTNYLCNSSDIGQSRSNTLYAKLLKINKFTNLQITNSIENNQDITIIINNDIDDTININEKLRKLNLKTIVLFSGGISGVIFTDCCKYITDDIRNKDYKIPIESITSDGIVKCIPYHYCEFLTGDIITFINIDGVDTDILEYNWSIEMINHNTFKLLEFIKPKEFIFVNGIAKRVAQKSEVSHKSLLSNIQDLIQNNNLTFDNEIALMYLKLYKNNLIKSIHHLHDSNNYKFLIDNNIKLIDVAKTTPYSILPVISVMCGILTNEVCKIISKQYNNILQWNVWYDNNLLSLIRLNYSTNKLHPLEILFGDRVKNNIQYNYLICGSNGLATEHVKHLNYYSSINNSNNIQTCQIVDSSNVKHENLPKNFIFGNNDVNKSKVETLKKHYNNNFSTNNLKLDIHNNILDRSFCNNITDMNNYIIINACDSINTRKVINEFAFENNIPFIDIGLCNQSISIQPIIPFVTETYSQSNDIQSTNTFPECVIKNFPSTLEHICIWVNNKLDIFWEISNTIVNYYNNILDNINTKYLELFYSKYSVNKDNNRILNLRNATIYAIDLFIEYYYYNIKQLLELFNPNHYDSYNELYWSRGKRCPCTINFNYNNIIHLTFVKNIVLLLFDMFELDQTFNDDELKIEIIEYSNTFSYDNLSSKYNIQNEYDMSVIITKYKCKKITKDYIITNYFDLIHCMCNLRLLNYRLNQESSFSIRNVIKNITPSVISTVACGSGLVMLELLKFLLNENYNNIFYNHFINLENNMLIKSTPLKLPDITIHNKIINGWEKITYTINSTIGSFIKYYEEFFNIKISIITLDTIIIYADFMNSNTQQNLIEYIRNRINNKSLKIVFLSLIAENSDIELPRIRINIK